MADQTSERQPPEGSPDIQLTPEETPESLPEYLSRNPNGIYTADSPEMPPDDSSEMPPDDSSEMPPDDSPEMPPDDSSEDSSNETMHAQPATRKDSSVATTESQSESVRAEASPVKWAPELPENPELSVPPTPRVRVKSLPESQSGAQISKLPKSSPAAKVPSQLYQLWALIPAAMLILMLASLPFLIPTSDAGLEKSALILRSALRSLSINGLHANASTVPVLDGVLEEVSRGAKISDDHLHRMETDLTKLASALELESLESQNQKRNALNEVGKTLEKLGQMIGSLLFVEQDERQRPLHTQIAEAVSELRLIYDQYSGEFAGLCLELSRLVQRRVNFLQLLIDLLVTAVCCTAIFRLHTGADWGKLQSAVPILTFAVLQILQERARRESFQSISPPATFAIIALAGSICCIRLSAANPTVKVLVPLLVALVAVASHLSFYSHACSVRAAVGAPCPPEIPCPISATPLATYDNSTKQLRLTKEAEFRLPKLKGPLYVLSEIGGFNTGKSVRLTMSYRLLQSKKLRDRCKCGFPVRDADADPTLVHTGKTRGMWMLTLPLSQINVEDIDSYPLRRAVKRLDSAGTIVFIDSEGGEEIGLDSASINLMQLLVVELSSHVNVAVKENLSKSTISHLGILAHLCRLYTVLEMGRMSCKSLHEASDVSVSLPEFAIISMKGRDLLPVFRDRGVKSSDGEVTSVPPAFSLDATPVLKEELEKASRQPESNSSASLVTKYITTLAYWGTLPATKPEMSFFKKMDESAGLPQAGGMGFVLGWSTFNFPSILNRVQPKTIQNEIMHGNNLLQFIKQFLHITRSIDIEWLRSENTKELSSAICQFVIKKVKLMLDDAKSLTEKFPIESYPACLNADDKCPDEAFEIEWSKIHQNITETTCFVKSFMTEEGWTSCLTNEISSDATKVHDELLAENRKQCFYRWGTGDWSAECDGSCPGYRSRPVQCLNTRSERRPSRCCSPKPEPEFKESCKNWTYQWRSTPWSECDQLACGTQRRSVQCLRCDGTLADDKDCLVIHEKPQTSMKCNIHFTYETGDWNPPTCSCQTNQIRSVWCQSNCGIKVETSMCEGSIAPKTEHYCGGHCHESSGGCFGSQNFVYSDNKTRMSIDSLHPGQSILSAGLIYSNSPSVESDEIAFFMNPQRKSSSFVTVRTALNTSITLTADHLLPVKLGYKQSGIELVPAGELNQNHHFVLTTSDSDTSRLRWVPISHVQTGVTDNLVVLHTMQDYALVSNIVASCHTGSETAGKAIVFPLKMIYKAFGPKAVDSGLVHSAVELYDELIGY